MKSMLIIEDDENISRGVAFAFEKDGFSVISASTLEDGRQRFGQQDFDIVILDLGLPDGDGMDLCKHIRENSGVPVIMLTARDLETDEVNGLSAGADDYITKPFSLSVLRARVDSVLRRRKTNDQFICSGSFRLDTDLCKLFRANVEIPVSSTEYRLLKYLMTNAGQILAKEQILAALWDNSGNFVDENALQVNISRLRAKIEDDPKTPQVLTTVHGVGYVWMKG